MALTKAEISLASAATVAATGQVGSAIDLTAAYGALLEAKLTNGATGPTTVPVLQVEVSSDNSNWYTFGSGLAGVTTNSAVTSWSLVLPIGVMYVRINVTTASSGGTAGTPTLEAKVAKVTAL